jgi:hypothetical protein
VEARYSAFWHTKELRRRADELINASENLMEKYERLRRQTGEHQKDLQPGHANRQTQQRSHPTAATATSHKAAE